MVYGDTKETGTVRYLFPKTKKEVKTNEETHPVGDRKVERFSPFLATVDFGDENALDTKNIHLYNLNKKEEEEASNSE